MHRELHGIFLNGTCGSNQWVLEIRFPIILIPRLILLRDSSTSFLDPSLVTRLVWGASKGSLSAHGKKLGLKIPMFSVNIRQILSARELYVIHEKTFFNYWFLIGFFMQIQYISSHKSHTIKNSFGASNWLKHGHLRFQEISGGGISSGLAERDKKKLGRARAVYARVNSPSFCHRFVPLPHTGRTREWRGPFGL